LTLHPATRTGAHAAYLASQRGIYRRSARQGGGSISFVVPGAETAIWQRERRRPKFKHFMDELIEQLPADLKRELNRILPDEEKRRRFKAKIKRMHKAPTIEMLRTYFDINPHSDDDLWMTLYIMYILPDIKYGEDKEQGILQLLQPPKPRLNKIVLRAIGRLRCEFPNKESHSSEVAKFLDRYGVLAPQKGVTVAQINKMLRAKAARESDASKQHSGPHAGEKEASGSRATQSVAPLKSSLVFDSRDVKLIRETLYILLPKHLDPDEA
jgi:hypothetical protein